MNPLNKNRKAMDSNARLDIWKIVNWKKVGERYKAA